MKVIFLVALYATAASLLTATSAHAKDVQVSMRGHWTDTSLVAEACESVAELGGMEAFWGCEAFVPSLMGKAPYTMAKDVLSALVPTEAIPVASVSLHARRFSPLVASQFQLMEQHLDSDADAGEQKKECPSPVLFTVDGQLVCGANLDAAYPIIAALKEKETADSASLEVTTTDKLYPADATSFPLVVYGVLGHDSTHDFLAELKQMQIPFIFRHHPQSTNSNARLPMQGYGVYMDVKNTEYKTTDERNNNKNSGGASAVVLDQDVIAGVNLTQLRRRFTKQIENQSRLGIGQHSTIGSGSDLAFTNTRAKLSEIALRDIEVEESAFKVPFWLMTRATMQIVDYIMSGSSSSSVSGSNATAAGGKAPKAARLTPAELEAVNNRALSRLADLTANFPLRMGAVLRAGDDEKREEAILDGLQKLWQSGVGPGTCTVNVNGQTLREEHQDFFHVLDLVASHEKHLLALTSALEQQPDGSKAALGQQAQLPEMIHHLGSCDVSSGGSSASAKKKPSNPQQQQQQQQTVEGPRYWIDNELVLWMNNVEKDAMYQRLRPSYGEVLRTGPYYQPLFPRKNIFNLVFILDATESDTVANIRSLVNYYHQGFAARMGVLFVDSAELAATKATAAAADNGEESADYFSSSKKKNSKNKKKAYSSSAAPKSLNAMVAAAFRAASLEGVLQEFIASLLTYGVSESGVNKAVRATIGTDVPMEDMLADKNFVEYYEATQAHARQLGFRQFPMGIFNGIMFNSLDRVLFNGFDADFETVREWVRSGTLTDDVKDIYPWMMNQHKAVKRFQGLLNDPQYLRIPEVPQLASVISKAPYVYSAAYNLEAILESNVLTLSNEITPLEWTLLTTFINHVKACGEACVRMRYSVVFVGDKAKTSVMAQFITDLLAQTANGREERRIGLVAAVIGAIDKARYAQYGREELVAIARQKGVAKGLNTPNTDLQPHVSDAKFIGAVSSQLPFVLCNGRQVTLDASFVEEDFMSLFDAELAKSGAVGDCFERGNIHQLYNGIIDSDDVGSEFVASKLASVASVILSQHQSSPSQAARNLPIDAVTVKYGPRSGYRHTIEAVIDPTKREGQRLVALINAIAQQVTSTNIVIYLNPPNGLSDQASMTTFYRFVFDSAFTLANPDFTAELRAPIAHFVNLPSNIVFTMGIDEPEAWMVFADAAHADLDNIRLADTTPTVIAEYGLHSILITGKCVDVDRQTAPKSLPLVLQPPKRDDITQSDTTVMSNFAYFQLRAQFGQWRLNIQAGEVAKKYKVIDIIETEANVYRRAITKLRPEAKRTSNLMVSSFSGSFVHLQVREVPYSDKQHIAAEQARTDRVLAITQAHDNETPTLNIFSVASGHLYERFLRMMFHTVVKTAREEREGTGKKTRVKFWLIENFLSPRFKEFLPGYAKRQGFDYQLISYHWPHWLRRQSQKQRAIWAYKILFLDVLFPLNLDKVIFVDADQIVRADLHELYEMDLEGKPMAYTPFCRQNMNVETKGFRFWDAGFWVDHLRGSPYHISAIYVVDLKRLRQMSGGDHYRMVYEQLSADPNSLANLDQDLPNYVQHQVPIFSLPEEWLWCETWCNAESKKRAKTIDLCNNPQTKIPKLENAKRIIPEWSELDESLGSF